MESVISISVTSKRELGQAQEMSSGYPLPINQQSLHKIPYHFQRNILSLCHTSCLNSIIISCEFS